MALTAVDGVSRRLGRELAGAAEVDQVTAWIDDVEAMVVARLPDVLARVDSGVLPFAVFEAVVANAVIRKIKNPDGKQNERIDDYSYGLTAEAARGELFLTDEEWALLAPGSSSNAFSIRPYSHRRRAGFWVTPTEWVPAP